MIQSITRVYDKYDSNSTMLKCVWRPTIMPINGTTLLGPFLFGFISIVHWFLLASKCCPGHLIVFVKSVASGTFFTDNKSITFW